MNNLKNISAVALLSSFSAETVSALEDHFRSEMISTLTSTLGGKAKVATASEDEAVITPVAPAKKRGPKPKTPAATTTVDAPKRGPGRPPMSEAEKAARKAEKAKGVKAAGNEESSSKPRQLTKDGRTASQVIRDFDEKFAEVQPAADVIAHCAKLGLEIAPALVYNVRKNVRVAEEAAAAEAAKEAKKAARLAAKAAAEKEAKKAEKPAKVKAEKPVKAPKVKADAAETVEAAATTEEPAAVVVEDTVAVTDTTDVASE